MADSPEPLKPRSSRPFCVAGFQLWSSYEVPVGRNTLRPRSFLSPVFLLNRHPGGNTLLIFQRWQSSASAGAILPLNILWSDAVQRLLRSLSYQKPFDSSHPPNLSMKEL